MASWNRNKTEYAPGIFLDEERAGWIQYVGRAESFIDSGIVRPEWMPGAAGCGLAAQAVIFQDDGSGTLLPPRGVSTLRNSAHGGIHIEKRGGLYYVRKFFPADEVAKREADAHKAKEQAAWESAKEARGPADYPGQWVQAVMSKVQDVERLISGDLVFTGFPEMALTPIAKKAAIKAIDDLRAALEMWPPRLRDVERANNVVHLRPEAFRYMHND